MTAKDARETPEGAEGLQGIHLQQGKSTLQANTLGFAEALHDAGLLPAERLAFVSNVLKPISASAK